ncbi:MAG: hypothetical protein BRC33_06305 [Cyanobacteria bacterium SW_9_44_58]|nr:MAG: hypothetical protein BRC33_06305 [Cyanobacteria bacterium SW_9_44_58]
MESENPREYEFDESQNELIQGLASTMKFVGYFLIAVGILVAISGIFTIAQGGFSGLVQGIVQAIIGFWTIQAAKSFQLIVDTEGRDIENLMGALGELRKLYRLQYWILMIALVFVVIGLIVGLVAGIFGS